MTKSNKKIAVFPGSFDPFHDGHLSVLEQANKVFDEVYVLISINENKQSNILEKRYVQTIDYLEAHSLKNDVIINRGLTVRVLEKLNAKFLIRGIRDLTDCQYELDLAFQNKNLNQNINTILFLADNNTKNIRSRELKKKNDILHNSTISK